MVDEEMLDISRLRKVTDDMIAACSSPAFVEAMRKMRHTPEDQRLKIGAQTLTSEALRSKGVPLPVGMRITSRYFEPGKPAVEVTDSPDALVAVFENQRNSAFLIRGPIGPRASGGCCCGGLRPFAAASAVIFLNKSRAKTLRKP